MTPDSLPDLAKISTLEEALTVINQLVDLVKTLVAQQNSLEKENAQLREQLNSNSSNSSKPPSSDPPFKKTPRVSKKKSGKKQGGQPGHKPSFRIKLPTEEVDKVVVHQHESCQGCGGSLDGVEPKKVERTQQYELPKTPLIVTEHQSPTIECPHCQAENKKPLPEGTKRLMGPRLSAFVASLVTVGNLSRRRILRIMEAGFGFKVALGTLKNNESYVADLLEEPCEEIHDLVVQGKEIKIDETTFYEGNARDKKWAIISNAFAAEVGQRQLVYLWVLSSEVGSSFLIRDKRNSEVAKEALKEVDPEKTTIISDRFSAYIKIMFDFPIWQVCLAHLLRDFTKISLRVKAQEFGEMLCNYLRQLFHIQNQYREGIIDVDKRQELMEEPVEILKTLIQHGPDKFEVDEKTRNTCENLSKYIDNLFHFVNNPEMEMTNNQAERELRPAVILRKITGGTMSKDGSRFIERMLTITMTFRRQNADQLDYLEHLIAADQLGQPPPALPFN